MNIATAQQGESLLVVDGYSVGCSACLLHDGLPTLQALTLSRPKPSAPPTHCATKYTAAVLKSMSFMMRAMRVTAGLKCPPLTWPKICGQEQKGIY